MNGLKPNNQRAKNAIILIKVVIAMEIIALLSGYFQYDLLQTVANGGEISMEAATMNDLRESNIALIYLVLYIVSAVTFIKWFRRAYFNLHQRVNNLSHSEGWAAGSWLVPIVSLYRPYQIMKELYVKTRNLLTNEQSGYTGNLTTAYLGWWWTLWLISGFIGQFILRYTLKAETVDQYIVSTVAGMVNNIIGIPLALLAIKVIKDYSIVEPMLNEIKSADGQTYETEVVSQLAIAGSMTEETLRDN